MNTQELLDFIKHKLGYYNMIEFLNDNPGAIEALEDFLSEYFGEELEEYQQ